MSVSRPMCYAFGRCSLRNSRTLIARLIYRLFIYRLSGWGEDSRPLRESVQRTDQDLGLIMKTWPTRTHYRLASIPLLVAVGLSSAAAEEGKNDQAVDIAALANSVTLDPKLARCTISKERKGDGLRGLMKALKDGKPPVVARAVHRWKQRRISDETRRTPKFVFGSETGTDKEAKLAIMSDESDSLAWGPTFDKAGGKKLYEKLGESADCKCDTPLDGELVSSAVNGGYV